MNILSLIHAYSSLSDYYGLCCGFFMTGYFLKLFFITYPLSFYLFVNKVESILLSCGMIQAISTLNSSNFSMGLA